MAVLAHLLGVLSAQHVHDVARAKGQLAGLVHAVDGGQQLARGVRAIPQGRGLHAVVAVAAGGLCHALQRPAFNVRLCVFSRCAQAVLLAEVSQQPHAAAVRGLGQAQQGIELAAHDLLEGVLGRAFVDHAALVDHVGQAVGHPGIGGQPVAACAAGFLVVALDVLGHVHVGHEAHIGLVDAHAEGDGGHDDDAVLAQEAVLVQLARLEGQARVVGQGGHAGLAQRLGQLLHALARLAIDHAGLALVLALDEAQQLVADVLLLGDAVADVGAVEAADEVPRALQLQPLDDVGARQRIGRGRERNARHARIAFVQHAQRAVFGPEVMAPLAHAVRLVDGEQRQLALGMQVVEQAQEARRVQALGRGIQQGDVAALQAPFDFLRLVIGQRGVQVGRAHTGLVQRAHLVVHERDQRRHHHRHAVALLLAHDGRHLVAQAFAAARGHEHQRIAAGDHVRDDGLLRTAELFVAEHGLQDGMRGGQRRLLSAGAAGAGGGGMRALPATNALRPEGRNSRHFAPPRKVQGRPGV